MNPMLASLNRGGMVQQAQNLKGALGVMKTLNGPGSMQDKLIMASVMKHPMYQKAKEIADQYGGDWNKAFEATAKQMGVNTQDIVSVMKQSGLC